MTTRTWRVEGRNGYYAVDEFVNGKCLRMVVAVKNESTAELIAGALAEAYKHGQEEREEA